MTRFRQMLHVAAKDLRKKTALHRAASRAWAPASALRVPIGRARQTRQEAAGESGAAVARPGRQAP